MYAVIPVTIDFVNLQYTGKSTLLQMWGHFILSKAEPSSTKYSPVSMSTEMQSSGKPFSFWRSGLIHQPEALSADVLPVVLIPFRFAENDADAVLVARPAPSAEPGGDGGIVSGHLRIRQNFSVPPSHMDSRLLLLRKPIDNQPAVAGKNRTLQNPVIIFRLSSGVFQRSASVFPRLSGRVRTARSVR